MEKQSVIVTKAVEPVYSPIKRDSLSKKVQDRILIMIRDGILKRDEKIPCEREFCESFQVSRTSIREALKGLISAGILEKRMDGTYVRNSTGDVVREPIKMLIKTNDISMKDVSEARVAVECQIVRIAAQKATPEDIAGCKALLEEIDRSATPQEAVTEKAKFHLYLAQMTKNNLLVAMFSVLYDILHGFRAPEDSSMEEQRNTNVSHAEILACIERGDADEAERIMRRHLMQVEQQQYRFS